MIIKEPFVKIKTNTDNVTFVADCASVCYGNAKAENPERLYNNLLAKNHIAVLRHASYYYIVPLDEFLTSQFITKYNEPHNVLTGGDNVGFHYIMPEDIDCVYFVANGQFKYHNEDMFKHWDVYQVDASRFNERSDARELIRYSFHIGGNIAATRELNRVSPNNILERSTRYCDYNRDKFGKDVTIANLFIAPRVEGDEMHYDKFRLVLKKMLDDKELNVDIRNQIELCIHLFDEYESAILAYLGVADRFDYFIAPDFKRGLLPLQTYSEVVYTYNVHEWRHIINLRYFGVTGKPHPDVEYLSLLVKDHLEDKGYTFLNPKSKD